MTPWTFSVCNVTLLTSGARAPRSSWSGRAGLRLFDTEILPAAGDGDWVLVTALYRAGRPANALAAHRRVTRMLADEPGVDPGPALADLAHRAGRDRAGHPPALPRASGPSGY